MLMQHPVIHPRKERLAYAAPQLPVDRLGPRRSLAVAALLILGVAGADYATGYAMRLSVLYLAPIGLAAWTAGTRPGVIAALLSCLLWLFSFKSAHFYRHQAFYFWEATVMLGGFLAVAWLSARLRRALSQADERFSRVIEEMRAAVYVADAGRDEILYANPEMLRIAGDAARLSPSVFGQEFEREAETGDPPREHAAAGFARATLKHPRSGRWYLMQDGPIPWGSNPNVRLRVLTDITERKNAELLREKHLEVMHQAAQLTTLAEIAATLAHEINQPLMVIATYTDACQRLLGAAEIDRAEIARALGKCHAQAVRAASIIERLREFIRQRQHRPAPCAAHAVIAEAIATLRPQLDAASVAVDVTENAPGLVVVADRVLLTQALINLIRNAVDAMRDTAPAARHISLACAADDAGEMLLSVADHGHGLNAATLEHIFAPFFTTKPDGLGLGLAICRSVAEAHGGRLWAENRPTGGAVFHLAIPTGSDPR
jgi:C4-dicarboxylate-specific signal transduction histidine kinase